MRNLRAQAELLAVTNVPVLILGESGSGKETTARLIHKLSVRSGFGFAKVNCAALPSDLLEAELFGYEQNGTGLSRSTPGKLELCEKGTILLDEITEMPMTLQAKLVQVLQHKRFVRPGTGRSFEFDVRVLAASTTNVEPAISENKLREDLYYLLERLHHSRAAFTSAPGRSSAAVALFHASPCQVLWPFAPQLFPGCAEGLPIAFVAGEPARAGKFRETLPHGRQRTGVRRTEWESEDANDDDGLTLPPSVSPPALPAEAAGSDSGGDSLKSMVQSVKLEAERNAIAAALERTGWNRKAAARLLKVSYRTLLYKIEQYQMKSSDSSLFPARNGHASHGQG